MSFTNVPSNEAPTSAPMIGTDCSAFRFVICIPRVIANARITARRDSWEICLAAKSADIFFHVTLIRICSICFNMMRNSTLALMSPVEPVLKM